LSGTVIKFSYSKLLHSSAFFCVLKIMIGGKSSIFVIFQNLSPSEVNILKSLSKQNVEILNLLCAPFYGSVLYQWTNPKKKKSLFKIFFSIFVMWDQWSYIVFHLLDIYKLIRNYLILLNSMKRSVKNS
jgi:hypothetical protein